MATPDSERRNRQIIALAEGVRDQLVVAPAQEDPYAELTRLQETRKTLRALTTMVNREIHMMLQSKEIAEFLRERRQVL